MPAAPEASGAGAPGLAVSPEAAGVMIGALEAVARINHIPRWKRSFRHGSIADRQRRLRAIVGRPVDRLPIDRVVRVIKVATVAVLALAGGASLVGGVW